jgi:hypothetical protein
MCTTVTSCQWSRKMLPPGKQSCRRRLQHIRHCRVLHAVLHADIPAVVLCRKAYDHVGRLVYVTNCEYSRSTLRAQHTNQQGNACIAKSMSFSHRLTCNAANKTRTGRPDPSACHSLPAAGGCITKCANDTCGAYDYCAGNDIPKQKETCTAAAVAVRCLAVHGFCCACLAVACFLP